MTAIIEESQSISIDKWGSLNTSGSPLRLTDGQSPNNQNVWTDEKPGSLVTANGYTKLGQTPSGNPATLLLDFYKTSDGSQTVIVSDGVTVWKTTNYVDFATITTGLSPFFQLRGAVIRGKLWLTNGSDPVMTYDGTTLTVLDGSGGLPNVPVAKYIAYHDERVWLYGVNGNTSSVRFSDLSDSAGTEIAPDTVNAWPSDNEIQVSEGDDDIGTALFTFRGFLYASKSFSVWRIVGYDEYTYTRVKTRASTGTRFQESVQIVDNLVHFIGVDGLYTFDGEEATRVSDIIDPASSAPGIFAFRNLQQNLVNNNFSNTNQTSDWATGTITANLATNGNSLSLIPVADSLADFGTGTHLRVTSDVAPGNLELETVSGSTGGQLISTARNAHLDPKGGTPGGVSSVGQDSYITDGSNSNQVGFVESHGSPSFFIWVVDLDPTLITQVTLKNLLATAGSGAAINSNAGQIQINIGAYEARGLSNGTWQTVGTISVSPGTGPTDQTVNFNAASAIQVRFIVIAQSLLMSLTEFQVYAAAFELDGKFTSAAVDYSAAPVSYGRLAGDISAIADRGETYQFFTQSSNDNSTWDPEVNVGNGGAIGSTLRRYLRWGIYLFSTGSTSPVLDKVYIGGAYISPVIDTGGDINRWGAFQLFQNKRGQSVEAYYRAATTSLGVASQLWLPIAPGAVPAAATTNVFIQIRLELSTGDAAQAPYVTSFTVNWIVGTLSGVNTLQNVASFVWLNRYWLSAATLGANANDVVLVRGKAPSRNPWMKKDFAILSFARFQDYFIAGSSTDGSIYRMEYGYSKNGAAMDSFFETQDYSSSGFMLELLEIIVNLDRMGPYTLSVGVSTDGGMTYTERTIDLTRATLTSNLSFSKKLNISFLQDKFRIRFRINAADQPFSIDSAHILYRLLPARGSLN